MDKNEIVQYCINRATECIELIPQATESEQSRLFERAEHWLKLGQRAALGEEIEEDVLHDSSKHSKNKE
jgi:hypothetical protein